jgi:TPP-dependent pyruvate/acetoin dehydrogenase alpha subunit
MSYEGSLYWSNYDSVKENIEYEFRMKMYSIIEEEIRKAVASGLPHTYVDGMDYIKTLVLDTQREKEDTVSQPTLL